MKKLLRQLLLRESGKIQLGAAFLGATIGFILLLGAIQVYSDFMAVFSKNDELINPEYIVLNKTVSLLGGSTEFSDAEIEEIKKQPFVDDIAPFIVNEFEITVKTESNSPMAGLSTELFCEAVPDKYLDVKDERWKWDDGDSLIPAILPKDYLDLYNFGFAPAKGLPQISGGLIEKLTFNARLRGDKGYDIMKAKIVGFSERINSILVPYDFLKWANEKYQAGEKTAPSRLLMVSNDPSNPELLKYLEDKNYETNKEKLKNSKLKFLLQIILAIIGSIAFIIISLAFLVFVLGFQLMITKSKDKLKSLLYLGYGHRRLGSLYYSFFILIIGAINVLAFIVVFIVKGYLGSYLSAMGFDISGGLGAWTFIIGLGISLVIILLNSWIISRQILKLGSE